MTLYCCADDVQGSGHSAGWSGD